jgi:carbamoylphosphate synthase small subunit
MAAALAAAPVVAPSESSTAPAAFAPASLRRGPPAKAVFADGRNDVLLIDNYDSFTYNVVQYLEELGAAVRVFRNDAISVDELVALAPSRLVISPGPGAPKDAGVSCDVIRAFAGKVPIFGVCLGGSRGGQQLSPG